MVEIEMETRFLEYIRNRENSPQLAFSQKPQELEKGAETNVYKFQLNNAPHHISKPLVLRVYQTHSPTHRAIIEGTTQNYLAEKGYPARARALQSSRCTCYMLDLDKNISHLFDFLDDVIHDGWSSPDLLTFLSLNKRSNEPENNVIIHLRVID